MGVWELWMLFYLFAYLSIYLVFGILPTAFCCLAIAFFLSFALLTLIYQRLI